MEAKDKAKELVDKYRILLMSEDTDCGNEILCTIIAKKAAKIAVNEIIKDYKSYRVKYWLTLEHALEMCEYWESVLKEIDNI